MEEDDGGRRERRMEGGGGSGGRMMGRSGGITLLKVHTAHSLQVFYCKCVWKCGCV